MKIKKIAGGIVFGFSLFTVVLLSLQSFLLPKDSETFTHHPLFFVLGIISLAVVGASIFFVKGLRSRLLHASLFILMFTAGLMFVTDRYASVRVEEGDLFYPSELLALTPDGFSCSVGPVRILSDTLQSNFIYETSLAWGKDPAPAYDNYSIIRVNHPGRKGSYRIYQNSWFLHFLTFVIRFAGQEYDLTKTSPKLTTPAGDVFSFRPVGVDAQGPIYSTSLSGPSTNGTEKSWLFNKTSTKNNLLQDFEIIQEEYRPGSELLLVFRPFYEFFLAACALFFIALSWSLYYRIFTRKNAAPEEET